MRAFFKKNQSDRNRSKALDSIKSVADIFRAYYLNAEKINQYFDQEYAGLVEFSTTHGSEIAPNINLSVESSALTKMIAGLQGGASLDIKKSQDKTEKYELSSILRFIILKKYWENQKRLKDIHKMNVDTLSIPHTLICHTGMFRFAESIHGIRHVLNDDQFLDAQKQYQFEKRNENEDHFVFLIDSPLAISMISKKYVTHIGFRYFAYLSNEKSETLFVGATIGVKHGLSFLDAISIGALEPS